MRTITKEWLQKAINQHESMRDEIPFGLDEDDSNTLAALRIALASLEAEPVAWLWSNRKHPSEVTLVRPEDDKKAEAAQWSGWSYKALYAAQPAPLSVPDEYVAAVPTPTNLGYEAGWNACRAAMLQSAEPVTTAYKLPDDFDFDRFNDVVWLEAVASNPHMHSLTTSTIAMVALELNKRLETGNSPVIPDGWVACSERMPERADEVLCAKEFDGPGDWRKKVGYYLAGKWTVYSASWTPTHWMPLPAAPKQEVKP